MHRFQVTVGNNLKKHDHRAPMQIQANRQDICSDISGEHVKPNLQHGEVTHECESRGRAVVACGAAPPASLPPSQHLLPLLSLMISLKLAPCPPLPFNFSLPFARCYFPLHGYAPPLSPVRPPFFLT